MIWSNLPGSLGEELILCVVVDVLVAAIDSVVVFEDVTFASMNINQYMEGINSLKNEILIAYLGTIYKFPKIHITT